MIDKLIKITSGAMVLTMAFYLASCQEKAEVKQMSPEEIKRQKLIERGKAVYMSECISCHNINPKLPGGVGPDLHGSSLELVTLRLLYLKYPEGYTPKRPGSEAMPEFPDLEADIPAIHAFLNQ